MRAISILYPPEIYCIIDDQVVLLPELVLKKYFKVADTISTFMNKVSVIPSSNLIYNTFVICDLATTMVEQLCRAMLSDVPDIDINKATVPQLTYVAYLVWADLMGSVKVITERTKNKSRPESTDPDGDFIKSMDMVFAEYHWTKEYVWNNITMIQFMRLLEAIMDRKEQDAKLLAAVHGIDTSSSASQEEKDAMRKSYGKQVKVDSDKLYDIKPGDINGLTRIALWVGVGFPAALNIKNNESNLRLLVFNRISELKKLDILPNIDITRDPIEACYQIEQDNIIGIKEKLEEIGLDVPSVDAIKQDIGRFRAVLMSKFISNLKKNG